MLQYWLSGQYQDANRCWLSSEYLHDQAIPAHLLMTNP